MTAIDLYDVYFDGESFVDTNAQEYYKVTNPEIFNDKRMAEWDACWSKINDMLNLIECEYVERPQFDDDGDEEVAEIVSTNIDPFKMLEERLRNAELAAKA